MPLRGRPLMTWGEGSRGNYGKKIESPNLGNVFKGASPGKKFNALLQEKMLKGPFPREKKNIQEKTLEALFSRENKRLEGPSLRKRNFEGAVTWGKKIIIYFSSVPRS